MRTNQIVQAYKSLNNWHAFRLRLFAEGILVGLLSGLIIGLFRYLLNNAEAGRIFLYSWLKTQPAGYIACWFAVLLIIAYVLYRMVCYEPMASGSGIPQVKGVILGLMKQRWLSIMWVKILGGALGLGVGLSLGREGPSIQLGAVSAQAVSRALGRTRMEERYLITSGAAAGLAAAFNAPLAGVIFSLEELHHNFSGIVLLPAMTAALAGTIVSRFLFGTETTFAFYGLPPLPLNHLPYVILIAAACGIGGVVFNIGLLNIDRFYKLPCFKNQLMQIAFALLGAGFLGFVLPDVLGGGSALVNTLAKTPLALRFLVALFVGKFIFTLVSYGCGVPGGFFLPMLVLGAMLGAMGANLMVTWQIIAPAFTPNVIIIAMAAFFAGSVRAPITGTVLILEMTGSFVHLMVLALGSAVAYIVAELLDGQPIYEVLLLKQLRNHNRNAALPAQEQRGIVEIAVSGGSVLEHKRVRDIRWPQHCIVVDIKRGEASVFPSADTRFAVGDYVYVLSPSENAIELTKMGEETSIPLHHIYGDF